MKRLKTVTAVAAAVCCFTATTQATFLAPNLTVFGDLQAAAGGVVLDSLLSAYSDPGLIGTVLSEVRAGDAANTLGGLSFYYYIDNTGGSVVSRLTTTGFGGVGIVDSKQVANGGTAPLFVTRDAGLGDGIGFNFVTPFTVPGPGISQLLIIHTAWTTWTKADASIIDSGRSDNLTVLAAVPEPTTFIAGALLLVPFALSTVRFMRNRATA